MAGAGALLLAAGCAGADAPPVEVVTITSQGYHPASLTVPVGTEVRFVSQLPARASVTSLETDDDGAVDPARSGQRFDSGPLGQGEAYRIVLDEPGLTLYHSTFQVDQNWVGTITVEGP